jgi:hypothetical protein
MRVQVFEVNSSNQRDGKHVLTQLQEATQSHQVSRATLSATSSDSERVPLPASADATSKETGRIFFRVQMN